MSLIGRIIAGARDLPFGGPLGALIEHAAQHLPHRHHGESDPRSADPRRSIAFTIAVIALGAKMARADGEVTRDEAAAFAEVFQVPPGEEEHVRLVFDLARRSTLGFETYARQIGRMFAGDRAVLENLLDGLFHIALADGRLCPAENAYLSEVARHFGFDERAYARLRAHHLGGAEDGEEDPFAVLGLTPGASPGEIRAAYRRLVRDSHPDLAIARGLPPECVALATARAARINAAYDRLARVWAPAPS
ncbi:MAG TPA: TerB family tellurite resistance protein [Stellaceae bacterium]|nr:TerB family tellurite resistance protein [Stellaceae bacterium]